MELKLNRIYKSETYTIGELFINNTPFCDTLEPRERNLGIYGQGKVKGKTAIPKGIYEIELRHSPHFNRTMPYLKDVPFFKDIMIHWGNRPTDTKGCILVGINDEIGLVHKSIINFELVYSKISEAIKTEKVTIEIS